MRRTDLYSFTQEPSEWMKFGLILFISTVATVEIRDKVDRCEIQCNRLLFLCPRFSDKVMMSGVWGCGMKLLL